MTPDDLRDFAAAHPYLVIDSEGVCAVFVSLRDMSRELGVDHSTISKRLKESGGAGALVTDKSTGIHHFVTRHGNSPPGPRGEQGDTLPS